MERDTERPVPLQGRRAPKGALFLFTSPFISYNECMVSTNALLVCKELVIENNDRMRAIHASGDYGEMVSTLDQLFGIATIMRACGYPVLTHRCDLMGINDRGEAIRYSLMGLIVGNEMVGLNLENNWKEIEETCRTEIPFDLSRRLTRRSPTVESRNDAEIMNSISHFFPKWHRWVEEKISHLRHNDLNANTTSVISNLRRSRL